MLSPAVKRKIRYYHGASADIGGRTAYLARFIGKNPHPSDFGRRFFYRFLVVIDTESDNQKQTVFYLRYYLSFDLTGRAVNTAEYNTHNSSVILSYKLK